MQPSRPDQKQNQCQTQPWASIIQNRELNKHYPAPAVILQGWKVDKYRKRPGKQTKFRKQEHNFVSFTFYFLFPHYARNIAGCPLLFFEPVTRTVAKTGCFHLREHQVNHLKQKTSSAFTHWPGLRNKLIQMSIRSMIIHWQFASFFLKKRTTFPHSIVYKKKCTMGCPTEPHIKSY